MSIIIKAHYDGKNIVPETDLDIPADQFMEVELRLLPNPTDTSAVPPAPCAKPSIRDTSFFGMWADRDDITNGMEWVRKERDKWKSRLTGTD